MTDNSPTPPNSEMDRIDLYDPQSTPDTLFGLFMMGLNINEISRILRVPLETLMRWVEEHEELRAANDKVARADALVLAGAFKLAAGHKGLDEKYYPPNLPAIKWWVHFRKVGLRKPDTIPDQNVPDDERIRAARKVIDEIENALPVNIKSRDAN